MQIFPKEDIPYIGKYFADDKWLYKLFSCDLCLGVWVYTILAFFFGANIYDMFYFPVVSEFLTGMTTSFIMHLISAGWRTLYSEVVIN